MAITTTKNFIRSNISKANSYKLKTNIRQLFKAKQEEVRDKRFGSKLNKTFTLDFAGRKVIDEQKSLNLNEYASEIEEILKDKNLLQQNTVINKSVNIEPKVRSSQ